MARAAITAGRRRNVVRALAGGASAIELSAVARIATHCGHQAVVEQRRIRKRIGFHAVAHNTFRRRRARDVCRWHISDMALIASCRDTSVIEIGIGKTGRGLVAGVAVLARLRGRMIRRFANRPRRNKLTAVTGIAARRCHTAVIEIRSIGEGVRRRHAMTQETLGPGRTRHMQRGQVAGVTAGATRRHSGMVEIRVGEGRRAVAIEAILRGLCRRMIRRFAGSAKGDKRATVARIATHAAHIAVIENRCLRKRIRRYAVTQHALRTRGRGQMISGLVFQVTRVAACGDTRVIETGARE